MNDPVRPHIAAGSPDGLAPGQLEDLSVPPSQGWGKREASSGACLGKRYLARARIDPASPFARL